MQVLLEHLLIAVIGAIAIIFVLLIFGLSIGYREKIEGSGIITYARIIVTPLLIIATIYFYLQ
jgi:NADH:ubiquinone oxidoreductase subunit 6 (subunit J)